MKTINDMTREELLKAPDLAWNATVEPFEWVIIVPNLSWRRFIPQFIQKKIPFLADPIHDSGYRTMTYVFGEGKNLIGKSTGGSDVMHVGGISAWIDGKSVGWSVDCLMRSGCLRLFSHEGALTTGMGIGLSSVEVMTMGQKAAHDKKLDEFRKGRN